MFSINIMFSLQKRADVCFVLLIPIQPRQPFYLRGACGSIWAIQDRSLLKARFTILLFPRRSFSTVRTLIRLPPALLLCQRQMAIGMEVSSLAILAFQEQTIRWIMGILRSRPGFSRRFSTLLSREQISPPTQGRVQTEFLQQPISFLHSGPNTPKRFLSKLRHSLLVYRRRSTPRSAGCEPIAFREDHALHSLA